MAVVVLIALSEIIGRFHPVLVHLPIGILVMAVALHWLAGKPRLAISQQVLQLLYGAGIAGALLSSITGFLLSNSGDYEGGTVALHMWLAILTTLVALFTFSRLVQQKPDARWLALLLLALITLTGHFGGSLTHGDDYLTSALGSEKVETQNPVAPIANIQEALVYDEVVQPLFNSRCVSCHGPNKQKGGLRMDSRQYLMKGGKNGAVLEPGNVEESELLKRLLLPREDEHHMPPKQKPQLTEAQVALVHWWVAQGASFDKKVAQLEQPAAVQPLLAALQAGTKTEREPALEPQVAVEAANPKAIAALRAKGVMVLPVAQNSPFLAANFVTAQFADADAALLQPLRRQLLLVNMNEATIGDKALAALSECSNLAVVHLNGTKVTDAGIQLLAGLPNLRRLSVVGTAITAKGLLALKVLPRISHIYLYGTPAVQEYAVLKAAFPKTFIDTGGYRLPLLASDTAVVKAVQP